MRQLNYLYLVHKLGKMCTQKRFRGLADSDHVLKDLAVLCLVSIKETYVCLSQPLPSTDLQSRFWRIILEIGSRLTRCFLSLLWILSPSFPAIPSYECARQHIQQQSLGSGGSRERESRQAGTITVILSGFPFLVTQCERASSCHCKNTTRS